jgi:hypothetical protein
MTASLGTIEVERARTRRTAGSWVTNKFWRSATCSVRGELTRSRPASRRKNKYSCNKPVQFLNLGMWVNKIARGPKSNCIKRAEPLS